MSKLPYVFRCFAIVLTMRYLAEPLGLDWMPQVNARERYRPEKKRKKGEGADVALRALATEPKVRQSARGSGRRDVDHATRCCG